MSSFTHSLLASDPAGFQRATQSPFLRRAAEGTLSKAILGEWLANDLLYIHGYIRAAGRLLSFLPLPETVPASAAERHADPASQLLAWTIAALVNIQREERFFVETATRYGINVNLPAAAGGAVPASAKLDGLRRFEALFDSLRAADDGPLPWLESAVVFYGTEKCYLEAWTWAKSHLDDTKDGSGDEDGGAVRKDFIANWTSAEFGAFVEELGDVIDGAVRAVQGGEAQEALRHRGLVQWRALLAAEEAFWPAVDA